MSERIPDQMVPVFERHGVGADDQFFLFRVFDQLIESDLDHATSAETVAHGTLGTDDYEELLESFGRGHRRGKTWIREIDGALSGATFTRRGRALLRDLAAVFPDWQYPQEPAR